MKELSIEKKAQRYDEALERANSLLSGNQLGNAWIYKLLPELKEKESEDERIREQVIYAINQLHVCECTKNKCLDWLKKQCEQKPADKLEPKFKPGDWITDGSITIQIEAIKNNCYLYCGDCYLYSTKNADKVYHLWTIQDAKDGDILVCGEDQKRPFIFKGLLDKLYPDNPVAYCGIDCTDGFFIPKGLGLNRWTDEKVEPATKEQHDLLFKKMEEAGYMWDSKNKEVQKIKQKPTNNQFTPEQADVLDKHIDEYLEQKQNTSIQINPAEYINDMGGNGCYLKNIAQSITWSDEDYYMLGEAIKCVNNSGKLKISTEEIEDWLKSLKGRVQPQQKQKWGETNCATTNEWSAEDKRNLLDVKCIIDEIWHNQNVREEIDHSSEELELLWHWLDNIWKRVGYPQSQWQPSDKELAQAKKDAYNEVLDKIEYDSENPTFDDGWSAAIWYLKKRNVQFNNTWRPSDEQLTWLYRAADDASKDSRMKQVLNNLLLDLKKLREK